MLVRSRSQTSSSPFITTAASTSCSDSINTKPSMVWHSSKPSIRSLPHTLGQQFHYVDELDKLRSPAGSDANSRAWRPRMDLLPPIAEEVCSSLTAHMEPPLAVKVLINFDDIAVQSAYTETYASSQAFVPTDRICRGLLRRIRHCSEELITRKDPDALNPTQCILKGPKQLRFKLAFEIRRNGGAEPWAKVSFQSFQKHALSNTAAMDVLRSTHTIIAVFLRRHDAGFHWPEEPTSRCFSDKPQALESSHDHSLDLGCVPSELFKGTSRSWIFTPGYSLELSFKPKIQTKHKSDFTKTVRVDSVQASPLTLDCSEDLLWQAYMLLQHALDNRRMLALKHVGGNTLQCDKGAFDLELRVLNHLGPAYDHLHRSLESSLNYIGHPESQYFADFIAEIQARFQKFRDDIDKELLQLYDFDFRIAELIGHGWREKSCARFTIDGKHGNGRRSIVALLDRIRAGVNDVLRGHDVAIRMVAYKRGHLIFDKALVAREHQQTLASSNNNNNNNNNNSVHPGQQQELIAQLKARIQRDIDMVCRDTCSLDDVPSGPLTPERPLRHSRSSFAPNRPQTPRSIASHRTASGSPSSFMFGSATPPDASSSPRSSRAFPLVKVRYRERRVAGGGAASSIDDSPVGRSVGRSVGEASKTANGTLNLGPALGLILPTSDCEIVPARIAKAPDNHGLRPAAEVFPVLKRPDADTDSISTHSSLPALTRSDTSSPEHSIFVTPDAGEAASPNTQGASYRESMGSRRLSLSWTVNDSAPSHSIFPEAKYFVEPTSAVPQASTELQVTADHGERRTAVPLGTPNVLMDLGGDKRTPLAHRQMQGPTRPEAHHLPTAPRKVNKEHDITKGPQALCSSKNTTHSHESEPDCDPSAAVKAGTALPHLVAEDSNDVEHGLLQSQKDCDSASAHADCTISNGSELPLAKDQDQQGVDTEFEGDTRTNTDSRTSQSSSCSSSEAARSNDESTASIAREEVGLDLLISPSRTVVPANIGHKSSRIRLAHEDQDEFGFIAHNKARISAPVGDRNILALHERARSVSGGPENAGHIPVVSSAIDVATVSDACEEFVPELEDKNIFSPITDTVFDFGFNNVDSVLEHMAGLGGLGWQTAPEVRDQDVCKPNKVSNQLAEKLAPGVLSRELQAVQSSTISGPTQIRVPDASSTDDNSAPTNPSAPRASGIQCFSSQCNADDTSALDDGSDISTMLAVCQSQPPSGQRYGPVGDAPLLPPLPIVASLVPNLESLKSTAVGGYDDDISSRQHTDDLLGATALSPTITANSKASNADGPHARRSISTTTTSLLGFHDYQLKELGIRGALTGTHAFDGRPAVSMDQETESELDDIDLEEVTGSSAESRVQEETNPPPSKRKVVVLKHSGSVSSTTVPNRMRQMKSNAPRDSGKQQGESIEAPDEMTKDRGDFVIEGDGEFSRISKALFVFAGLAIASTAISRYRSS